MMQIIINLVIGGVGHGSYIRVTGNQLFPLVTLKAKVAGFLPPNIFSVRICSSITDTVGFIMNLNKQSGPDINGNYTYWANAANLPCIGQTTQSAMNIIGVKSVNSNTEKDDTEFSTIGVRDSSDVDAYIANVAFATDERGRGRLNLDVKNTVYYGNLDFLRSAGIEKLYVMAEEDHSQKDIVPAKHQVHLLYYTGHGSSIDGTLQGIWDNVTKTYMNVGYIDRWASTGIGKVPGGGLNPHLYWSSGLDTFIIAGCSILNIPSITNFPNKPNGHLTNTTNWGLFWANNCLATRTPGASLRVLCGYYGKAPLNTDKDRLPAQVAVNISNKGPGYIIPQDWLDANNMTHHGMFCCAMDANTYYWHKQIVPKFWMDEHQDYSKLH